MADGFVGDDATLSYLLKRCPGARYLPNLLPSQSSTIYPIFLYCTRDGPPEKPRPLIPPLRTALPPGEYGGLSTAAILLIQPPFTEEMTISTKSPPHTFPTLPLPSITVHLTCILYPYLAVIPPSFSTAPLTSYYTPHTSPTGPPQVTPVMMRLRCSPRRLQGRRNRRPVDQAAADQ